MYAFHVRPFLVHKRELCRASVLRDYFLEHSFVVLAKMTHSPNGNKWVCDKNKPPIGGRMAK